MPATAPRQRFIALGRAVRAWADAETATYALLYGAPVPGYVAPEITTVPGTRVPATLLGIARDASEHGLLVLPSGERGVTAAAGASGLAGGLAEIRRQFDVDLPDEVLVEGVLAWTSLFGQVSFEVFGQFGADRLGDPAALFELHLDALADRLGLSDA